MTRHVLSQVVILQVLVLWVDGAQCGAVVVTGAAATIGIIDIRILCRCEWLQPLTVSPLAALLSRSRTSLDGTDAVSYTALRNSSNSAW